ncbi:hypothetical protein ACS0TY_008063 [Phlomoides rotata]
MDQRVKQMLKLIEEDGDSFAKKAEMYYQKRPELIRLVEDFYRRYRSLAERYDNVSGELRKTLPLDLQSQGSGISDFGSEPPSAMPSPDRRPNRRRSGHRAPGFDFFLGGNGSELCNREGYESSTLDSESESDEFFGKSEDKGLHRKILDLEAELRDVKEKLQLREEEISEGSGGVVNPDDPDVLDSGELDRTQTLEEELRIMREKVDEPEKEILSLSRENKQLQDEIRRVKDRRAEMELQIEQLKAEIGNKNDYIQELTEKLDALQGKYDELVSENDDLNRDASFKDDQIDQMSNHLNQLHMEHVALIDGAEAARIMADELRSRIGELEREVEKKQEIIVQGAEEKREAIRQLCFSLEHYRKGYHRLREVVTGQKPPVESTQVVT